MWITAGGVPERGRPGRWNRRRWSSRQRGAPRRRECPAHCCPAEPCRVRTFHWRPSSRWHRTSRDSARGQGLLSRRRHCPGALRIAAASQFVGPAHQLFGRHDHLRLHLEVEHAMIAHLDRDQVLADKVDARQIPPRSRKRLQDRQRFVAILDQPDFPRAVIDEVVRDRGRANFIIVDKNPCPRRIRPHGEPPMDAAARRRSRPPTSAIA